jgi:protein-S-isoprenylcysteine O-methyltransferase Ste14
MATAVIVLRVVPLLAFAGAMPLMGAGVRRGLKPGTRTRGRRAPLVANLAAFAAWAVSLLAFSRGADASRALFFAVSGSLVALAGVTIVVWSRAELGPSWSFSPEADQDAGLVTTGPYRLVRHPIYLGLALLSLGEALAFASWPAGMIVACGLVPTFLWRAHTEEQVLSRTFGETYAVYRHRTRSIIPWLL